MSNLEYKEFSVLKQSAEKKSFEVIESNIFRSKNLKKIMKPFIDKQKPAYKDRLKRGQSLFQEKKLVLGKFSAVDVSDGFDWESNPLNNRSWQWHLSSFYFLNDSMVYNFESPSDSNLDFIAEIIADWVKKYLGTSEKNGCGFIWHDQATGLRAERVAVLFHYLVTVRSEWCKRNMGFLNSLVNILHRHGEVLADEGFYTKNTNHGLIQTRALYLLATIFKGYVEGNKWKNIAVKRLHGELAHAFTEEGVHVENSPGYHLYVFKVILLIILDNPPLKKTEFGENFLSIAKKAIGFLSDIVQPNGKLPIVGDSEETKIKDSFRSYFKDTIEYQNLLYVTSKGKRGIPSITQCKVYEKSGYVIFRKKLSNNCTEDFHLIFKAGCLSKYHSHRDEGSFIFSMGGEKWLIDSGMYNYNYETDIRKYMTSRMAHNVIHISNSKFQADYNKHKKRWVLRDGYEKEGKFYIDSELYTYQDVNIRRTIMIDMELRFFTVNDKIITNKNGDKKVSFYWHYDSDKIVDVEDGGTITISSRATNKKVLVNIESSEKIFISKMAGVKDGKIISIVSNTANKYQNSTLLKVKSIINKELECSTRFSLFY